MPISGKDREFMEQVATYFRGTKSLLEPDGSIRETSLRFNINRNKVRKILITMGEIESPLTETVLAMRKRGMTVKEIAKNLGISVATVSTALPYEDKMDNTLEPSEHAVLVREYRAYEKKQLKRQAGRVQTKKDPQDIKMSYTETCHRPRMDTWEEMDEIHETLEAELKEDDQEKEREIFLALRTGQFPGALNDRNTGALEKIAGSRLPPEPEGVLRLHMELFDEYAADMINDGDAEVLRKYGKLEHGRSISRDVIVPEDIPLYALHYMIQRAFGWQNSHLRQFELPEKRFLSLTSHNVSMWRRLVGVLFRSPLMDEADEFWADDYNGGSFKNWLRRKYTGPYLSQCHGEGILSCQKDMMDLDMDEDYYVMYSRAYNHVSGKYDGEEYVSEVLPVRDYKGKKRPEPKPWHGEKVPCRVEVVKLGKVPSDGLRFMFDRNPMALLERLPINSVLAAGKFFLPEDGPKEERRYVDQQISGSGDEVYARAEKYIKSIINRQVDAPDLQVPTSPVTDELLYNYDFGDNWKIRITASRNCVDLVESGRITQAELDRANVKCREVYRPVLIARDGEMLVDDVGGIHGFTEFLQQVNPELKGMDPEEKEAAKRQKKEYLEWARSLGWHREKVSDFNLL